MALGPEAVKRSFASSQLRPFPDRPYRCRSLPGLKQRHGGMNGGCFDAICRRLVIGLLQ
jgi:hypothetical protein